MLTMRSFSLLLAVAPAFIAGCGSSGGAGGASDAAIDAPSDAVGDGARLDAASLDGAIADGDTVDASVTDAAPRPVLDGGASLIVFAGAQAVDAPPQIYSLSPSGGAITPITSSTSASLPTGANDAPSFSPDGTTIVFDSGRDFSSDGGGTVVNPTLRMLYTMKPDGSGAKRLTSNNPLDCSEHDARFSHDGTWVVFSMSCDNVAVAIQNVDQLYRIKADGTAQVALVPSASTVYGQDLESPAFSSDDTKVVFVADDGSGATQLYAVDVASGATTQLTNLPSSSLVYGGPVVGSTNLIYFATGGQYGVSTPGNLNALGWDGGAPQSLFSIPDLTGALAGVLTQFDFALSPDGTEFVFGDFTSESDSGTNVGSTYAISSASLDGGGVHALTTTTLYEATHPSWR